jgi:tetratricopeptide (TPR) repeat protein
MTHSRPVFPRPQPLGILPLPAGWLVLPDDPVADEGTVAEGATPAEQVRRSLLAGLLPQRWPERLEPVRLAAQGEVAAAAALVDPGAGPVEAYNHFVLTGEPSSLAAARSGCARLGPAASDLAVLVEVAGYSLGHDGELPAPEGTDGEIAAHLLAAQAAAAWARGDLQGALDTLVAAEQAAQPVSAVLAALLLGQQAGLLQAAGGADADVIGGYREATDALRGLDAVEPATGELVLGLAIAYQDLASGQVGADPSLLVEAVRAYHLALRLLRKESHPQRYAFAHSNLALAYLAMPVREERDTLRRAVAVQSLREALTYYTRQEHPVEWASVTLNLANALQHLKTTHPVENLIEAVGMYDDLLEVRDARTDPLGYARVLANQGTALAHLGIHDRARERLAQARELFAAQGDASAVRTVEAALADIEAVAGAASGSAVEG